MQNAGQAEAAVQCDFAQARWYATKLGWPTLPINPVLNGVCICGCSDTNCSSRGKHPLISGWRNAATTDLAQIDEWIAKWPHANIAHPVPEKEVVLDFDGEHCLEAVQHHLDLEFSGTSKVRTGRGSHLYFKLPEGVTLRSGTNVVPGLPKGCKVDIRAYGSYVILPPSIHYSGRLYDWEIDPGNKCEMPEKLLAVLNQKGEDHGQRVDTAKILRGVSEGERDSQLFKLACKFRAADIPREIAEVLILKSATSCTPEFPKAQALKCL